MADLRVRETAIPGVLLFDIPVHGDNRGWFKENWQREKMLALGLPDFEPVQNNISYNENAGTTRGIHAEPWDKFISVVTGRIFGAWVDLRENDTFGTVFTAELGPDQAIYVPRGVGNSYQTLEEKTGYTYLVNAHWSATAEYTFLNLADETVAIKWPIPLEKAELSEKDIAHPRLPDVAPILGTNSSSNEGTSEGECRSRNAHGVSRPQEGPSIPEHPRRTNPYAVTPNPQDPNTPRTVILGANGQLGRELVTKLPAAIAWGRPEFDISEPSAYREVDWSQFDIVINAAAYTKVDEAETLQGRRDAWRVNVHGVVELAKAAIAHDLTLVHVSSDYVFDGEIEEHTVDELFSPLGVYGQTKAAGDSVVSTVPRHYIVRTSWVIGDGPNFVRTMESLAQDGVDPSVVDDQIGRLTYVTDLADGIIALFDDHEYGTHNITSSGEPESWFHIARRTFAGGGHDPNRVAPTSTAAFSKGRSMAPRPRNSALLIESVDGGVNERRT
jgi:dTDP-4-dehydrorhamnose reductase/dTDP-4-dehydrorhamnose 3,5-epimerase